MGGQPKQKRNFGGGRVRPRVDFKIGTAGSNSRAGPVLLIIMRGIVPEEVDSAFFLRPYSAARIKRMLLIFLPRE
jgi:hypothetical protein